MFVPRPRGAHADHLANSRWHPSREQLRQLRARAQQEYRLHKDDLLSVQLRLGQLDPELVWYHECKLKYFEEDESTVSGMPRGSETEMH
jgi:hypothetical protein